MCSPLWLYTPKASTCQKPPPRCGKWMGGIVALPRRQSTQVILMAISAESGQKASQFIGDPMKKKGPA